MKTIDRSNYWYEYSIEKANFLMLNNALCKGTGINKKSKDIFWCFDKKEVAKIMADIKNQNEVPDK